MLRLVGLFRSLKGYLELKVNMRHVSHIKMSATVCHILLLHHPFLCGTGDRLQSETECGKTCLCSHLVPVKLLGKKTLNSKPQPPDPKVENKESPMN